jgi:hypothetical protein
VARSVGDHGKGRIMRKLSLMTAMLFLLVSASVRAQDSDLVTVQDDVTNSFIVFSIKSGEYKYIRCGDQSVLYGFGKVTLNGCNISLEDVEPDRRVLVSVNICDQEGKAAVEVFEPTTATPMREYFKDSSMKDNVADCVK